VILKRWEGCFSRYPDKLAIGIDHNPRRCGACLMNVLHAIVMSR
jgi:hypothetical protein